MRKVTIFTLGVSLLTLAAAQESAPTLPYQTGNISILDGRATVQADANLRYLDAAGAKTVLVDLWGNPPETAEDVLGMLVPGNAEPHEEAGWAIVITESEDGHVSDDDASSIDYNDLLHDLQSGEEEENAARTEMGYEPAYLLGWAEQPSYDPTNHKMIWAQQLAFGDKQAPAEDQTLNYEVRVLGRESTLELNAVSGMDQLPTVKADMNGVLQRVSFTPGNRYEDYTKGDKTAAYGIAGLVAGGVAAKKLGFLALLLAFLKKGWIVIAAALGGLARFFRRS